MKVLHINSYYAQSKFYNNLFEEELKHDIDVRVYVPVSTHFRCSEFNYGWYTLISRAYPKWKRAIFHFKHWDILRNVQEKYDCANFNLYHAHSWFSNGYVAYKLNQKFSVPYVVAVRNTDINVFYKYMLHLRGLGMKILFNASRIVFISPKYKENFFAQLPNNDLKNSLLKKSVIIPNGVDDFWLENMYSPREERSKKRVNLLYVGNIDKNKNLSTTSRAIDLLIKDGFDVTYTVVGKINDQKIFQRLKRKSYFHYLGVMNKEQLLSVYRENDIFVMPSYTETFGLVYVEALSQGLPVIYSKGQGFDGWFRDGEVGYPVVSSSYEDIYKKIKDMTINPIRPRNAAEMFAWHDIAKQYSRLYEEALRGLR